MENFLEGQYYENSIEIVGIACSKLYFFYKCIDQTFYMFDLSVKRKNNKEDIIRVCIPKKIADQMPVHMIGTAFKVEGEIRTLSLKKDNKSNLEVYVFPRKISIISNFKDYMYKNEVILSGRICKPVHEKKVAENKRTVVNFMIINRRKIDKNSYIPCVAWNDNALFFCNSKVGQFVRIKGILQSRYVKKFLKDVYEVSVRGVLFE